jgi:predicted RNA binding protein YcfA (HicA-like mRNA interferase family)
VIVPLHGAKPLAIGTLKSIIEGAGLSVEDFR